MSNCTAKDFTNEFVSLTALFSDIYSYAVMKIFASFKNFDILTIMGCVLADIIRGVCFGSGREINYKTIKLCYIFHSNRKL